MSLTSSTVFHPTPSTPSHFTHTSPLSRLTFPYTPHLKFSFRDSTFSDCTTDRCSSPSSPELTRPPPDGKTSRQLLSSPRQSYDTPFHLLLSPGPSSLKQDQTTKEKGWSIHEGESFSRTLERHGLGEYGSKRN